MKYERAKAEIISFEGSFMTASHPGIKFTSTSGNDFVCDGVYWPDWKPKSDSYPWITCPSVYGFIQGQWQTVTDGHFKCWIYDGKTWP